MRWCVLSWLRTVPSRYATVATNMSKQWSCECFPQACWWNTILTTETFRQDLSAAIAYSKWQVWRGDGSCMYGHIGSLCFSLHFGVTWNSRSPHANSLAASTPPSSDVPFLEKGTKLIRENDGEGKEHWRRISFLHSFQTWGVACTKKAAWCIKEAETNYEWVGVWDPSGSWSQSIRQGTDRIRLVGHWKHILFSS